MPLIIKLMWVLPMIPLIPLILLVITANKFLKVYELEKYVAIAEVSIDYKNIKSFFPRNIKNCLMQKNDIEINQINSFISEYKIFFIKICSYVTFWSFYIIFIIVQIVCIAVGKLISEDPTIQGVIIGSVLMQILITYWLFLTPIFEFLQLNRLVKVGLILWSNLNKMVDFFTLNGKKLIGFISKIIISFIPLSYYLKGINWLLIHTEIKISLWVMLVFLLIYQYLILDLVARMLNYLCEKVEKLRKKCYTKGIIKKIICNCTYLCMVFIYAISIDKEISNWPLPAATGILFLIDTFVKNDNEIRDSLSLSAKSEVIPNNDEKL